MYRGNRDEQQTELFSSQFEQIKTVESQAEKSFYYAMFGYDLIMGQCRALDEDRSKIIVAFTKYVDYESYLLPGVSGNESFENPLRVYNKAESSIQQGIYEVGGYAISRVPQCYMYSFPIERDPLLYVSMTECSALVAHNEHRLYVAHIGLSETGEVVGALKFFREHGIELEQVNVHASIGDTNYATKVVQPYFDFRHANFNTYKKLGIPADNIHPFEYRFNQGNEQNMHENTRGVFVGNDFQVAFSFDMKQKGLSYRGDNVLKDIISVESA
jgi:hypothetical protein